MDRKDVYSDNEEVKDEENDDKEGLPFEEVINIKSNRSLFEKGSYEDDFEVREEESARQSRRKAPNNEVEMFVRLSY